MIVGVDAGQSATATTHDVPDADKTSLYRSAVARLNYWAVDKPDIHDAVGVMTGRDSHVWQDT